MIKTYTHTDTKNKKERLTMQEESFCLWCENDLKHDRPGIILAIEPFWFSTDDMLREIRSRIYSVCYLSHSSHASNPVHYGLENILCRTPSQSR